MLKKNNPNIDFDALNARISEQLEHYQQNTTTPPEFVIEAMPIGTAASPSTTVTNVQELLALEDQEFVSEAYKLLLGRPADIDGLNYHLDLLRSGEEKSHIINNLSFSAEGKRNAHLVPGRSKQLIKRAIQKLPVIKNIFASLLATLSAPQFRRYVNARFNHFHRLSTGQTTRLDNIDTTVQELQKYLSLQQDALDAQDITTNELKLELVATSDQLASHKKHIEQLKIRIAVLENQRQTTAVPEKQQTTVQQPQSAPTAIEDAFYVAFEDHFRGSADTITHRLQYYIPLIQNTAALNDGSKPSVDIGCGRGEWLNVLRQEGFETLGIDLNAVNVQMCSEAGHKALQTDGLAWLQAQPDNSLALISSFHVIEHLTFEQFGHLLTHALRTLIPGGMLILETPNPENLITGATHFYTDPTHLHPLPPAFTEFTVSYKGFTDVNIHRLNPIPEEFCIPQDSAAAERCNTLFYGPQDYAITAIKPFLND